MGWFDSQIKERNENDGRQFQKACWELASIVSQKNRKSFSEDRSTVGRTALEEICNYFHLEAQKIPERVTDIQEQMEYIFRPHGIMRRNVKLKGEWWKDSYGPLLAEKSDGSIAALIPEKAGVYTYKDSKSEERIKITDKNAGEFNEEAICFYRPLPQRPITNKELFIFLWEGIAMKDKLCFVLAGVAVMLLGMITPAATAMLLNIVLPSGQSIMIYSIAVLLAGTAISKYLFSVTKSILRSRMEQEMNLTLQSAVFARVISLPVSFFKEYPAGDLAERVVALGSVSSIFCEVILGAGLTALFSLGYIVQIFVIAPVMVLPSLIVIILQLLLAFMGVKGQVMVTERRLKANAKVQGIVFELFSGVQKIKLSGSERRAFAKWAEKYKESAETSYNPPFLLKIHRALSPSLALLGTLILYWTAYHYTLDVTKYVAFSSAYGMINGAILALAQTAAMLAVLNPILDLAKPVLEAQPEISTEKETLKKLSGNIELNNVSFRYTEDGPMIIDNLSLKIKKGQYIAIVGTTGCGKSTLMRLIMGFEKPLTGAVYYDGKDLERIDQKSLRGQIGVVMQNGKLFSGDIYSNIAISAPKLTLKEAWEAAEMAGIAEDIKRMPMGMHTVLSEGAGGISGGQKQRLMIARAIAPKPKVLMFDEATSALDNITQKQVSDALMKMKSTRIVIAHRLSTIKECDRIIVLDKGRIIEDGTYDELNKQGGFFAELVARQQVNPV